MLVHSASRFIRTADPPKTDSAANSIILFMCDLLPTITRQNLCRQASMAFKILFRGLFKLHVFLMGNSPA